MKKEYILGILILILILSFYYGLNNNKIKNNIIQQDNLEIDNNGVIGNYKGETIYSIAEKNKNHLNIQ